MWKSLGIGCALPDELMVRPDNNHLPAESCSEEIRDNENDGLPNKQM